MAKQEQTNFNILKQLSRERIRESRILFAKRKFSGAYYLAGYSIELALKAYYCKQMSFPPKDTKDLYCHNLETLLLSCGLKESLLNDIKTNHDLGAKWGVITKWSEESRYLITKKEITRDFLDAIDNKRYGILIWIMKKL
ncbi:MAG: DNA-binding protein [Candidatus Margulisiibacteriota bacterium]